MTDARYPAEWLTDIRVCSLSCSAHRSFVTSLAWSAANKTDGQIDSDHLALIPGFTLGDEVELAKSQLWVANKGGWFITIYLNTQTSRAEHEALARARLSNRKRQAAWKARRAEQRCSDGNVTDDVSSDVRGTVTETVITQEGRQEVLNSTSCTTEDKNVTVIKPASSKAKSLRKSGTSPGRGTRLPEGWEPPEDVIRAMHAELPHLDLRAQHLKFTDYFRGASGQKGVKLDWAATWRNWMRTANERGESQLTTNGHPIGRATEKAMAYQSMKHPIPNGSNVLSLPTRKEITSDHTE